MKTKNVIIGAGISGLVIAQRLAEKGEDVLIIEQRNHIGGNCYDYRDENGFLIHKYGLHIFHTDYENVWEYMNRFGSFTNFQLEALSYIDGKKVPIPFNINSIYQLFSNKIAEKYENVLLKYFELGSMVSILEMQKIAKKEKDEELSFITNYIFEKVFKNYIIKQWQLPADKIDSNILNRVKVSISRDNRYFKTDKYQGMPENGYTKIFEKMINYKNIKVILNTDYKEIISDIEYQKLFYTGSIDYFFDYKFGKLEYKKTKFVFENHDTQSYQESCMVSYPNDYEFTRITEFKKFYPSSENFKLDRTVICKEFPGKGDMDDYPVEIERNIKISEKYKEEANKLKNAVFIGRLANYKYYDMDDTVFNALELKL